MSETTEQLEWMTLETFATVEEANALTALLNENAIESNVINDANMGGDPLGLDFQNRGASAVIVRVHTKDIDTARRLLEVGMQTAVAEADEASLEMFESFSDEELLDVLKKPDEWNPENIALAQKLLASHGKTFTPADLKKFFDERIESLREPVSVKMLNFVLTVTACVIALILALMNYLFLSNVHYMYVLLCGGILATMMLIAGLNWTYRKKRLPNGEKIFVFSKRMRIMSFVEMVLAALALGLTIVAIAVRVI